MNIIKKFFTINKKLLFSIFTTSVISFSLILSLSVSTPTVAFAQDGEVFCGTLPEEFCDAVLGAETDPQKGGTTLGGLQIIIDSVGNILVGLYGIIAVLTLIISGLQISASAGSPEVVKSAKSNTLKVLTGFILLLCARAIIIIINNVATVGVDRNKLFCAAGTSVELCDQGIPAVLGNIITTASFFSGIVAVIFVIVGGIRLIASAGNPKAIEGARRTITYAIAGLVLSISAYGILVFIQTRLTS